MGQIVFQATLGGQTALVGQNTASSYSLTLPLATDMIMKNGLPSEIAEDPDIRRVYLGDQFRLD